MADFDPLVQIDDMDPNIFKTGVWKEKTGVNAAFGDAYSFSTMSGATMVVRFIGTSIEAGGRIELTPKSWSIDPWPPVYNFRIDNGPPVAYAPEDSYIPGDWTTFYRSGELPVGEHVLTMTVIITEFACGVDDFINLSTQGEPRILRSDGSRIPITTALLSSTASSARVSSTSQSSSSVIDPTTTARTPNSSTKSTSSSVLTQNKASSIGSSSIGSSSTGYFSLGSSSLSSITIEPTIINGSGGSGSRLAQDPQRPNQTTIIAAVLASLLSTLVIVVIILLMVCRRRRQARRPTKSEIYAVDPYVLPVIAQQDPPAYGSYSEKPTMHLPQQEDHYMAINDKTRG